MEPTGNSSRAGAPERSAIAELADRFDLADVYVFGSRAPDFAPSGGSPRASGATDANADLDIGVRSIRDHRLSARRRAELVVALEDLFDARRVDLVIVPEAPPFLALAVIMGELLYTRDTRDQAEYELYVLRRAGDLAPFKRERRALVLGDG